MTQRQPWHQVTKDLVDVAMGRKPATPPHLSPKPFTLVLIPEKNIFEQTFAGVLQEIEN